MEQNAKNRVRFRPSAFGRFSLYSVSASAENFHFAASLPSPEDASERPAAEQLRHATPLSGEYSTPFDCIET